MLVWLVSNVDRGVVLGNVHEICVGELSLGFDVGSLFEFVSGKLSVLFLDGGMKRCQDFSK